VLFKLQFSDGLLGGTVHSDDAKSKAADVAKEAAGNRTVVNEVSVQPVGAESDAKSIFQR
jgi:osmotically-inducible protein OsmY